MKLDLKRMTCRWGRCRCPVCGKRAPAPKKGFVLHSCPGPKPARGLGDMVSDALSLIGITKERVTKLVGRDCGCKRRQEALNRAGRALGIGKTTDRNP